MNASWLPSTAREAVGPGAIDMEFELRKLGRTEAHVPPVMWRFDSSIPSLDVLIAAESEGAHWLLIPHATPVDVLVTLRRVLADRALGWSFVIGVEMESLRTRVVAPFEEKLRALELKHCAAVLVEQPNSAGVKSGWPFHRLGQLRERGATSLFFVDSSEATDAEWIVEHTPAHAVILPFSEHDQLAKYRLLELANEMGVAVVAKPSEGRSVTSSDIGLRAAETGLTAQVVNMPGDLSELEQVFLHLRQPMISDERASSWQAFRQRVPEPVKFRGAHPPEFG